VPFKVKLAGLSAALSAHAIAVAGATPGSENFAGQYSREDVARLDIFCDQA
jgi:hypothetical protein